MRAADAAGGFMLLQIRARQRGARSVDACCFLEDLRGTGGTRLREVAVFFLALVISEIF